MRNSRLFQHFARASHGGLAVLQVAALSMLLPSMLAMAQPQASDPLGSPASSGVASGASASVVEPPPRKPPEPALPTANTEPSPAPGVPTRQWMRAPRVYGQLTHKDIGVLINLDDPYSVQVGEYYVRARQIPADQVLRLRVPVKNALSPTEFAELSTQVDAFFGSRVQGLAVAWRTPYAVDCNAITGALTLGFDPKLCSSTCAASRPSAYFGSASTRPYQEHRMRLSMLLAARDVDGAKALIDRGVKSDATLGFRGAAPVSVHFVTTSDSVRSVRQLLFPPAGLIKPYGLDIQLDQTDALRRVDRVLMYLTGRATVDGLDTVGFVPGALADHLTSFGGVLDRSNGQMSVLSWIEAGATASYGTTSEPCAHLQKFPNPQALLLFYVQGATALEAYWKSVLWPQQGLFVGEPLAAPFSRR